MAYPLWICSLASMADWISGEPMQPLSWWVYPILAAAYTLIIFIGYVAPDAGPQILSLQNARKRSTIIGVHCAFLAVFLGTIWMACRNLALMPAWLTERALTVPLRHSFGKASLLEILFLFLLLILRMIEMPCIYAESKTPHAGTFENPSAPRWMNPPGD
jgi:hypothetical protein